MSNVVGDVTQLLCAIRSGDPSAEARLLEVVSLELRKIAANLLRRERKGHTLQPTALVNELYVQMLKNGQTNVNDRGHLFAMSARAMRRILVDYARASQTEKRGGKRQRIDIELAPLIATENLAEMLEIDQALTRLQALSTRQCRVVELRFFAGMDEEEIAEVLQVSSRTVKRDWRLAKAWLHAELSGMQALSLGAAGTR